MVAPTTVPRPLEETWGYNMTKGMYHFLAISAVSWRYSSCTPSIWILGWIGSLIGRLFRAFLSSQFGLFDLTTMMSTGIS